MAKGISIHTTPGGISLYTRTAEPINMYVNAITLLFGGRLLQTNMAIFVKKKKMKKKPCR